MIRPLVSSSRELVDGSWYFFRANEKKKCSGSFACDRSTAAPNVKYFVNALDRLIESPTSKACTWPLTCFVHNSTVWTWPSNLNSFKSSPKLSRAIFFLGARLPVQFQVQEAQKWRGGNEKMWGSRPYLIYSAKYLTSSFFFLLPPPVKVRNEWEVPGSKKKNKFNPDGAIMTAALVRTSLARLRNSNTFEYSSFAIRRSFNF